MRAKCRLLAHSCALALAVLVIGPTAGALATTYGEWWVNGSHFSGTESIQMSAEAGLKLSTSVGSKHVEFVCTRASGAGTITESSKGTISPGLELSECKVNSETTPACKTNASVKTVGLNSTLEVSKKTVYNQYEAISGKPLFMVVMENCALEGEYNVTGTARCEVNFPTEAQTKKSCVFTQVSGSKLKFGSNEAGMEGAVSSKLTGTNEGKTWAAGDLTETLPHGWALEGRQFVGEEKLSIASSGSVTFQGGILFGGDDEIKCESMTAEAWPTIFGGDESEITPVFSGCKFAVPSGCSMPATMVFPASKGVLEHSGEEVYEKFTPSSKWLADFEVTGCALEGEYSIKGSSLRCQIPHPLESSSVKECDFDSASGSEIEGGSGSSIAFTANTAMELIGANKGRSWSIES